MALIKSSSIDKIELLPDSGSVQVRRVESVIDDQTGEVVAVIGYHRSAYTPLDDISKEDDVVQQASNIVRTPDIIKKAQDQANSLAQLAQAEAQAIIQ